MNNIITIDGIKYVPETELKNNSKAVKVNGLKYVIIRTYSAGVFAGSGSGSGSGDGSGYGSGS